MEQVLGAVVKQVVKPSPEQAKPAPSARQLQAVRDLSEIFDEDLNDIMKELGI
jgi:hypothetical protein